MVQVKDVVLEEKHKKFVTAIYEFNFLKAQKLTFVKILKGLIMFLKVKIRKNLAKKLPDEFDEE